MKTLRFISTVLLSLLTFVVFILMLGGACRLLWRLFMLGWGQTAFGINYFFAIFAIFRGYPFLHSINHSLTTTL